VQEAQEEYGKVSPFTGKLYFGILVLTPIVAGTEKVSQDHKEEGAGKATRLITAIQVWINTWASCIPFSCEFNLRIVLLFLGVNADVVVL
jgi:hypothetical protein